MLRVYNNYLDKDTIDKLLTWLDTEDKYTDKSSTIDKEGLTKYFISKNISGDCEGAPLNILIPILDNFCNIPYTIDEIIGMHCNSNFPIHADSGVVASNSTVAINIALWQQNSDTYTVFFDNYWHNHRAKFIRGEPPITSSYGWNHAIVDYTYVKNFNDKPFDKTIYDKYLKHLSYENLHGLTTHSIIKNTPGSVMVWDRTMLHSSGYSNSSKKAVVAFLNKNAQS